MFGAGRIIVLQSSSINGVDVRHWNKEASQQPQADARHCMRVLPKTEGESAGKCVPTAGSDYVRVQMRCEGIDDPPCVRCRRVGRECITASSSQQTTPNALSDPNAALTEFPFGHSRSFSGDAHYFGSGALPQEDLLEQLSQVTTSQAPDLQDLFSLSPYAIAGSGTTPHATYTESASEDLSGNAPASFSATEPIARSDQEQLLRM